MAPVGRSFSNSNGGNGGQDFQQFEERGDEEELLLKKIILSDP